MTRQEIFEKHYAEMHDLPAETMQQYRWLHQDGYRLPGIAAAYRNFCAGWDACEVVILPRTTIADVMRQQIPYQELSSAMSDTAFQCTQENKP